MLSGIFIISMVFGAIGWLVSLQLKNKFNHYSQIPLSAGLTGEEVAYAMLRHYGIGDVSIVQGEGMLTDHYNPQNKTVSLSPDVYYGRSVAAAAVAAHECGHAVQHAEAYSMLQLRSALVPAVQFSANVQQYLFMLGFIAAGLLGNDFILMIAIAAFGITTLFSLVTLPVEFDASNRALAWFGSYLARGNERSGAQDALWWAATTYVVAAIAAVAQLLYLVNLFTRQQEE